MIVELVDDRVLGAIRFLDAETGLPILSPLSVAGEGIRFVANRSGMFVITRARTGAASVDAELAAFTGSFQAPPDAPAHGSVALEFTVADPGGRYLSRVGTVHLPRSQSNAAFSPVEYILYPSPIARPVAVTTSVRLSIAYDDGEKVAGAIVEVSVPVDENVTRVGRGLSDARGEAIVFVPRIPVVRWGEDTSGAVATAPFEGEARVYLAKAGYAPLYPDERDENNATLAWQGAIELVSGREHRLDPITISTNPPTP